MKNKALWIVIGVLCAAAVLWLVFRPTGKSAVTLETAMTERIEITSSVTATGTVEPVTKVDVGTQVSGIVDKLYADYNDIVKAGQVIAEMDKVNLRPSLSPLRPSCPPRRPSTSTGRRSTTGSRRCTKRNS